MSQKSQTLKYGKARERLRLFVRSIEGKNDTALSADISTILKYLSKIESNIANKAKEHDESAKRAVELWRRNSDLFQYGRAAALSWSRVDIENLVN